MTGVLPKVLPSAAAQEMTATWRSWACFIEALRDHSSSRKVSREHHNVLHHRRCLKTLDVLRLVRRWRSNLTYITPSWRDPGLTGTVMMQTRSHGVIGTKE